MTRPISIRLDLVGPRASQQPETPPPRRRGYCPPRDGVARVPTSMRLLPASLERLRAAAERDGTGVGVVVDYLATLLPPAQERSRISPDHPTTDAR